MQYVQAVPIKISQLQPKGNLYTRMRTKKVILSNAPEIIAMIFPLFVPLLLNVPNKKIPNNEPYVILVNVKQSHKKSFCVRNSQAIPPRITPKATILQREINK